CSHLDEDLSTFDDRGISLDRNHARRPDHLAGADIELPAVKIALDDIVFDEAFRQRARAVRAVIVGHEEFAAEVEDGERQIVPLALEHGSIFHVASVAKFDLGRHRLSLIESAEPAVTPVSAAIRGVASPSTAAAPPRSWLWDRPCPCRRYHGRCRARPRRTGS